MRLFHISPVHQTSARCSYLTENNLRHKQQEKSQDKAASTGRDQMQSKLHLDLRVASKVVSKLHLGSKLHLKVVSRGNLYRYNLLDAIQMQPQ